MFNINLNVYFLIRKIAYRNSNMELFVSQNDLSHAIRMRTYRRCVTHDVGSSRAGFCHLSVVCTTV